MIYGNYFLNESLIFNQKDIYKDFDKWESGKSNVLLVTGLSGSGKSTLAKNLAKKYNAEHFEIDTLEMYYDGQLSEKDLEKYEPGILAFIKAKPEYNKESIDKGNHKKTYIAYEYLKFVVPWCKKQKDKKFIIEGLQIYDCFDPKDIDSFYYNPLIIKGTSAVQSAIRGAIRNTKADNNRDEKSNIFKEFKNLIQWALKDEKGLLKDFRKFGNKSE